MVVSLSKTTFAPLRSQCRVPTPGLGQGRGHRLPFHKIKVFGYNNNNNNNVQVQVCFDLDRNGPCFLILFI